MHNLINQEEKINKNKKDNKTSEQKNDHYADPGDELTLKEKAFTIENVYAQKLKDVTDEIAQQEGYENLEAYKEALTSIHESVVWDPEQVVWAHEFKEK